VLNNMVCLRNRFTEVARDCVMASYTLMEVGSVMQGHLCL